MIKFHDKAFPVLSTKEYMDCWNAWNNKRFQAAQDFQANIRKQQHEASTLAIKQFLEGVK